MIIAYLISLVTATISFMKNASQAENQFYYAVFNFVIAQSTYFTLDYFKSTKPYAMRVFKLFCILSCSIFFNLVQRNKMVAETDMNNLQYYDNLLLLAFVW
jgi:hypothetical protein